MNTNHNRNNNTAFGGRGGDGGDALGVGIGIGKGGDANSSSNASSESMAIANTRATSGSSAYSDQSQDSEQSNSQTMNYTESDRSDTYEDYTPSAYAPSINATVPCLVPISSGVGVPGFSGALGTGVVDTGCEQREIVRIALESEDPAVREKADLVLHYQLNEVLATLQEDAEREEAVKAAETDNSVWAFQGE